MNALQATDTATALHKALADIPREARAVRAYLRRRAREYTRAAKLYVRTLDDHGDELAIGPDDMTIMPRAALDIGMTIMTSVGPRRIVTFSANGVGYSDAGMIAWENGDAQTPFVVLDVEVD